MTVVYLCLDIGAFREQFTDELAAALGVRLLDLRPLELSIAELDAFGKRRGRCADQQSPATDELSMCAAEAAVEAVSEGDVLIVGWSAAPVLAPLSSVTRVRVRAPRPRGAWRTVRRFGYETACVGPYAAEPSEPFLFRIMRATFGDKWRAPSDFDLVVEAAGSSAQDCQREIVEHVRRRGSGARSATAAELGQIRALLGKAAIGARDWQSLRGCAVSVDGIDVGLAGIDSQEAAIAMIEQNLHGNYKTSPPANPMCLKTLD